MKNKKIIYSILIIATVTLTGCSHDFSDWLAQQLYESSDEIELTEAAEPEIEQQIAPDIQDETADIQTDSEVTEFPMVTQEPLITVVEEQVEETDEDPAGIPEDGLAEAAAQQANCYAYSTLSSDDQKLYLEILSILSQMRQNVKVSSTDENQIDRVFKCVMIDHPEIFYVQGYSMTKLTRAGILHRITLSGTYTMSQNEKSTKEQSAVAAANAILGQIPSGSSEYEKVRFVYEYLVKNTEYDLASEQNQNILSVFLNGRSVCQGYAKSAQYLLNHMGMFCTLAEGVVKGTEPHVWNIVRIDGKYYNMDVTWGDASYNISGDVSSDAGVPEINYDYLNIPDAMLQSTHVVKTVIVLPTCDSMDANYYVREGIYFTSFDENQLARLFNNAYAAGEKTVQLKCADMNVYQAFYQHLITDEQIFQYLNGGSSVRYIEMKEQLSMLFYL